jgi:2-methylcitrate dehydratase PrpD
LVVLDPELSWRSWNYLLWGSVDVHLGDGSVECETLEAPRGSEQSFATRAEIVEKFRKLTRHALPQAQQDALIQSVLEIEAVKDSKDLIRLLQTRE